MNINKIKEMVSATEDPKEKEKKGNPFNVEKAGDEILEQKKKRKEMMDDLFPDGKKK